MVPTLLSLAILLLGQAQPAPPGRPPSAERFPPDQIHPAAEAAAKAELLPAVEPADHAAPEGEQAARAGEHGEGGHAAAGRGEHDASVSGTIFHHVLDEPAWVRLRPQVAGRELNLDIGKHVVSMWIAAALLVLTLLAAARKRALVPKGLYNFIESLVVFIRDEIAVKNIGEHGAHHYTPYLCTAFFFILFMNLFGLFPIPGVGTPTSNLSVTVVLALFTFTLTQIAGMREQGVIGYWAHLVPSGVPKWLYPIMLPVEFLGLFTKPFALTVRLFANMLAGHIVIYFLLALTVLLTVYIAPVSIAFALGIYLLEIFVALVQAYVFTMLSALFIGMASHGH